MQDIKRIASVEQLLQENICDSIKACIRNTFTQACMNGDVEVATFLYSRYERDIPNDFIDDTIYSIIVSDNAKADTIAYLCSISDYTNMLFYMQSALFCEKEDIVDTLLQIYKYDHTWLTESVILSNSMKMVRQIIPRIDPELLDEFDDVILVGKSTTMIMYFIETGMVFSDDFFIGCATAGKYTVVRRLIEECAMDYKVDDYSAFIGACRFGHLRIVKYFAKLGVPISILKTALLYILPNDVKGWIEKYVSQIQIEIGEGHCSICYADKYAWLKCDNDHKICSLCYKNLIRKTCPFCRVLF